METKDKLRIIRETKDLSQAEFGREIGIAGNYVGMIERGDKNPSGKLLTKILTHFRVNPSWWETSEGEVFRNKEKGSTEGREEPPFHLQGLSRDSQKALGALQGIMAAQSPEEQKRMTQKIMDMIADEFNENDE